MPESKRAARRFAAGSWPREWLSAAGAETHPMTQSTWSDDRIAQLKYLWQEGLSASQVADTLGGVSRNAVIGKVHRLRLAGRGPYPSTPRCPRSPRALRPARSSRPSSAIAAIEMDPLPLADGTFATMRSIDTQMCRWPIGDPATSAFHFCGRPHKEGSSYCEAHALRAHQPRTGARHRAKAGRAA